MSERSLETWPFAPGESPYQIKGTAYRGHIAYVEENIDGGMDAMIEALPTEELQDFFRRRFLAGSLYDIYPLVYAGIPCARMLGMGFLKFAATRAEDQAPRDLSGVYHYLLRMVPTGSVAKRIPRLLSQVLSFGTTEVLQDAPLHMRGALHGMPKQIAPWFSEVGRAYAIKALEVSGALETQVVVEEPVVRGVERGVPLTTLVFDIRWQ